MGAPTATMHRSFGIARRTIAFKFWPNSTSAALAVDGPDAGAVSGVVRSTTGVYVATLHESYKDGTAIGAIALSTPAQASVDVVVSAGTSAATSLLVTRLDGDSATDDTAHAGNCITIHLEVEASSAG